MDWLEMLYEHQKCYDNHQEGDNLLRGFFEQACLQTLVEGLWSYRRRLARQFATCCAAACEEEGFEWRRLRYQVESRMGGQFGEKQRNLC